MEIDPRAPYPLMQSPQLARTIAAMGGHARFLQIGPSQALILRRFGLSMVSRPMGGNAQTYRALAAEGVRVINANQTDGLHAAGFRQIMTPATLTVLELNAGRRSRMQGKWRNRLMAANGSVTARPYANDDWLIAADQAQQRARRYRGWPAHFTAAYAATNPDDTLMVQSADAAMLFLIHGSAASYHIGITGPEGRETHAHNLLLDHAATLLAERGCKWIDLGTIDTDANPGLARFKLGSGARALRTGGTWLRLL